MVDSCTVRRVTNTVNPATGADVVTSTTLYTGRAKVQTFEAFEQTPNASGHEFTVQRYSVHLPVGSFAPAVGDLVDITAATLDDGLTGRTFRVVALLHKTAATAYRLAVTELVA